MKTLYSFILGCLCCMMCLPLRAQHEVLLNYIQHRSDIREGGSEVYQYEGETILVTVTTVEVGRKSLALCQKVGSAKAKRDLFTFVNGSEISSVRTLKVSETTTASLEAETTEATESYVETIRESVLGTVAGCNPLGGWYSDDRSIYYYAIFKKAEI